MFREMRRKKQAIDETACLEILKKEKRGVLCMTADFYTQEWRGERLPLEGKLAQLSLRLMRSKLPIITIGWYKLVTFDLIRSGLSRTTFPSRGRLFSVPSVLASIFTAQIL